MATMSLHRCPTHDGRLVVSMRGWRGRPSNRATFIQRPPLAPLSFCKKFHLTLTYGLHRPAHHHWPSHEIDTTGQLTVPGRPGNGRRPPRGEKLGRTPLCLGVPMPTEIHRSPSHHSPRDQERHGTKVASPFLPDIAVAFDPEIRRALPEQQLGERRQGDRRKKDGLGLLPPSVSPQERENRSTLNTLIGALLSAFGAFIAAGGVGLLGPGFMWSSLWSIILGIAMLGQGLRLVGRRERRQSGRRKVRADGRE
jgi:hypothetical protein